MTMDSLCLYAAADLHGRRAHFELVARQSERPEVQMVILAGDLVNYRWGHANVARLAALSKPVLAVRGNTDSRRIEASMSAARQFHLLDCQCHTFNGFRIVGVSGTLPVPFRSRIGWSERRRLERLASLIDAQTILVAHPPPWGIRDRVAGRWHAGSTGLRRLIQKTTPAVLICGHIHEAAGIEAIGPTLVVNCALGKRGRGAIIRYDGSGMPSARML